MKTPRLFVCFAALSIGCSRILAADGTWTNLSGGAWNVSTNWASNTVADGATGSAYFNTLSLGSDISVTLGADRTIKNLTFANAGTPASNYGWTISGANTLTLQSTSTIFVGDLGTGRVTISSVIAGTSFTKTGVGTLQLSGANTFSGNLFVSGGKVITGPANLTGADGSNDMLILSNGAVLETSAAGTINRRIQFRTGGGTIYSDYDVAFKRIDAGGSPGPYQGTFTKTGSGVLTISGTSSRYYGDIYIQGGTLRGGVAQAFEGNKFTISSGATLDLGGFAYNLSKTGSNGTFNWGLFGSGTAQNSGGNLIFNYGNFSGNLKAGNLLKDYDAANPPTGSNELILSGVNEYTGITLVNKGTLVISGSGSINGTSSISVNGTNAVFRYDSTVALTPTVSFGSNGGTFLYNSAAKYTGGALSVNTGKTLGGRGVLGAVTLASGGTLTPGEFGDGSAGLLTVDSLSLQAGSITHMDVIDTIQFDSIYSTGSKALGGGLILTFSSVLSAGGNFALMSGAGGLSGNFSSITASGAYTGAFSLNGGVYELVSGGQTLVFDHLTGVLSLSAIPEPSSIGFLTFGLGSLLLRRRKKA